MSEHIQLELIAAFVLVAGQIITAWRANTAAQHAQNADRNAIAANEAAVITGKESAKAIEQVHEAVNGGMAAAKAEIAELKLKLLATKMPPERHEEIRGQK